MAMESLLAVLEHDAPHDVDSAKAVLETFMQLCEVPEKVSFGIISALIAVRQQGSYYTAIKR